MSKDNNDMPDEIREIMIAFCESQFNHPSRFADDSISRWWNINHQRFSTKTSTDLIADKCETLKKQREACADAYRKQYLSTFDRLPNDNDPFLKEMLNATIEGGE